MLRALLVVASFALLLVPQAARAACSQVYGCDAVTEIEAALEGAPECLHVEETQPHNGCVCQGHVVLSNDCSFAIDGDGLSWIGVIGNENLPPGKSGRLAIYAPEPGEHREEFSLEGDGEAFTLVVEYTAEFIEDDASFCSVGRVSQPYFLGLACLALIRRRRRVRPR